MDLHSAGPIFCDEGRECVRPTQSVDDEQNVVAFLAKNRGHKRRYKLGEIGTSHGATLYGGHGSGTRRLEGVNLVRIIR